MYKKSAYIWCRNTASRARWTEMPAVHGGELFECTSSGRMQRYRRALREVLRMGRGRQPDGRWQQRPAFWRSRITFATQKHVDVG
ncbi:hypothetical protein C7399_102141 [Paraburkholderia tropica]|uniref:Uncharacterized protein n=1 Tax=Paraburkholderia tropica TaxID=92647 RepID=A0ABX5MVB7_9BURK|nr:hypothetical protein C7400_102141 [Paraburkholderia tropica]PZW88657.1 hypothetical protein C7399_102141 [Paraburkholderia tropica]